MLVVGCGCLDDEARGAEEEEEEEAEAEEGTEEDYESEPRLESSQSLTAGAAGGAEEAEPRLEEKEDERGDESQRSEFLLPSDPRPDARREPAESPECGDIIAVLPADALD